MKKILVPTDFSPNAAKALEFAANIARKADAEIIIVHVYSDVKPPFGDASPVVKKYGLPYEASARCELESIAKALHNGGVLNIHTIITSGSVTAGIVETAKENQADLVVMGTLGDAAFKEKLFGSITAAIIGKAFIPVLAIPLLAEWVIPANILMAVNHFDEEADISTVLQIAELYKAKVRVAVFSDNDKEDPTQNLNLANEISEYGKKIKSVYRYEKIETSAIYGYQFEETINKYIVSHEVDMLAMFTHKKCLSASIIHRSMTRKLSYHINIPLLAIPVHTVGG